MTLLFWISAGLFAYAYAGYPLFLWVASAWPRPSVKRAAFEPRVSIIMAVHNEEEVLCAKLESLLALQYPREKLEILVVSDHSSDRTNALARRYHDQGVQLLELTERCGKHLAQIAGIEQSNGEILVFTDAAALLDPRSLALMMEYFADPTVGCVTSEDRVLPETHHANAEGLYIRYLMLLRRLESRVSSVVGLSGSYFAARRYLCQPWWSSRSSDFAMALRTVEKGLRGVNAPDCLHYYASTPDASEEFHRKVRTVLNGFLVFGDYLAMLNPFRYGLFSIQYFSHKPLRWSVPVLLVALFVASVTLAPHNNAMAVLAILQVLSYLSAWLGHRFRTLTRFRLVRVPYFFCLTNAAIVVAFYELLAGKRSTVWAPTRRMSSPS